MTATESKDMYQCQTSNCGYVYDKNKGNSRGKIETGTLFNDLPKEWKCPVCGASKKMLKSVA